MTLNSLSKDKDVFYHQPSSTFFSNRSCLDALEEQYGNANIDGRAITNLRFSDGVDALAVEQQKLEALLISLDKSCTRYMTEISAEKTTSDDKQRQWYPEEDQGKMAEAWYSKIFEYFGAVVIDDGFIPEVLSRTAEAT